MREIDLRDALMPGKTSNVMWSRLFELRDGSSLTIQGQIRQLMISAISDEHITIDTPVPSSRELAEQLGIARNTVVLAYQQLVDDGYLVARKRSGYFVNPDVVQKRPSASPSPSATKTSESPPAPDWETRFRIKPSRQRNISKPADWQSYEFPFIYGQFDPSLFPTNDWRECCQQALSVMEIRDWAPDLFTRDDAHLIEQIRTKVLPLRGVWAQPDEIIVTIGAQQALYLLADLLIDPQTQVGIENPGYPDARNILSIRTPKIRGLPIDDHGLLIGPELKGCSYIYATPSHQSPTTATMPMDRRVEFLKRAEADDFIIIEDDYESETSFSGPPNPALKSFDRGDRVIYVGSLSKTLAPGLRLGYIVAPRGLADELRSLRRLMIRHPTAFIQRSFALFLSMGHYGTLNRRLMTTHRDRAAALSTALKQHMPNVTHKAINGGSSFWITGPEWLDCRQLAVTAEASSILIEPGDVYFMQEKQPVNFFRLGFSSIQADRISEGIKRLATLAQQQNPSRHRSG